MAERAGTAQDPIPVATQASQQGSQDPYPPISQQHQSAQLILSQTKNIDVAISGVNASTRLEAVPNLASRSTPLAAGIVPLPAIVPLQNRSDPEDPICTSFQRNMLDIFRVYGRWGLTEFIYEQAKSRKKVDKSKSWAYLTDDVDSGTLHMYQLSMLLPDYIIESLIKNTLPYDFVNDGRVRNFVSTYMNINVSYPGVYVNILTRAANQIGFKSMTSAASSQTGRWLSSSEADRLVERVEKYMANRNSDEAENVAIDNCFLPSAVHPKFDPDRKRIREWQAEIRKQYCTNTAPNNVDIGFKRCPFEVGFSQNIRTRCAAHITNRNTTAIFGLVNAITRQSKAQGGFAFPEAWQLVLFPLWANNQKLAQVAEVFGSVLCSSYWFWGGMNIHLAGYSTLKPSSAPFEDNLWTEGIRATRKRLDDFKILDLELQHTTVDDFQVGRLQNLTQLKASIAEDGANVQVASDARERDERKRNAVDSGLDKDTTKAEVQREINANQRAFTNAHVKSMLKNARRVAGGIESQQRLNDAEHADLDGRTGE